MKNIPLFWPNINRDKVLKELKGTLGSRWVGQGPKVERFEKKFGKKFGYKYPLFVNSGTAALELAYHLIGIGKGDEVITPILNCTAGQNGILRSGAKLVFADIEKETFNMDPDDLERKITKKTKAIVAVHLGGIEVNDRIFKIAKEHNIPVISDAAQRHTYVKGDYVIYSFQAIKHMTTGDGGMLVLNNKKEYHRAKLLRWFGIDRDLKAKNGWKAWERRQMTFDIYEPGYKFQPTDIDASLGLVGLSELNAEIAHRKKIAKVYEENINPYVTIVAGGTYWLFGITSYARDNLADYLTKFGIDTNMVHLRNDIFEVFGGKRQDLPNMDWVETKYLYLPINIKVTEKDALYVCKRINEFYDYLQDEE